MRAIRQLSWIPLAILATLPAAVAAPRDGSRDFDWEHGRWQTQLKRRLHPLAGSDEWVEYAGTTVVRPVLGGRANLVELEVAGKAGRIEGMSLRTYDPSTGEWLLHFANVRDGRMAPPTIGRFDGQRGEFYSDETLDGRPIRVRFAITVVSHDTARFEQAFSADGGRTWETNWIAVDTRSAD